MKKLILLLAVASLGYQQSSAQDAGYQFTPVVDIKVTPVKNQASSGTCWSFATAAFVEAELLRMGKGEYDLSEMFNVRQKYMNQLNDNYLRRGKGNLGQGSLSHTWFNVFDQVGAMPEEAYTGINYKSDRHSHGELNAFVQALAEVPIKVKRSSPEYKKLVNSLFDIYLGEVPEKFTYKGKEYTPITFAQSLGLKSSDYVELTSFTHLPFYEQVELEIPDNWEHAKYYNLPLDEMMAVIDNALMTGYTVAWDGDVSEKGFSFANGVAIMPEVNVLEDYSTTDRARFEPMPVDQRFTEILKFQRPFAEVKVTPEVRQTGYETFTTTDDHLMHLTGIQKDQNGTKYYKTKNSWGTDRNKMNGYLNMSNSYVRAKTTGIMVHKDAIPAAIAAKLKIQK